MIRKAIQTNNTTLAVTLPKKWVKEHNVTKGDEIEVDEERGKLIVGGRKEVSEEKKTEIDISELDRSTYEKIITSLYVLGYYEITIISSKRELPDFKLKKNLPLSKIVNLYLKRLIGFEIISQTKNRIVIRHVSKESPSEFDTIFRRIFFLILEFQRNMIESVKKGDKELFNWSYESYDNIYKFRNYAERLLMKDMSRNAGIKKIYFTMLNGLEDINHHTRFCGEDISKLKNAPSKQILETIELVAKMVELLHEFVYKFDFKILQEIIKIRFVVRDRLANIKTKEQKELLLLSRYTPIIDIINLLTINVVELYYCKVNS